MTKFIGIALLTIFLLSCNESKNIDEDFRETINSEEVIDNSYPVYPKVIDTVIRLKEKSQESIILSIKTNHFEYQASYLLIADRITNHVQISDENHLSGTLNCHDEDCNNFKILLNNGFEFNIKSTIKTISGKFHDEQNFSEWDKGRLYIYEVLYPNIKPHQGVFFISSSTPAPQYYSIELDWSPYAGYNPRFKWHKTHLKTRLPKDKKNGEKVFYYQTFYKTTSANEHFQINYFNLNLNFSYRLEIKIDGIDNE